MARTIGQDVSDGRRASSRLRRAPRGSAPKLWTR